MRDFHLPNRLRDVINQLKLQFGTPFFVYDADEIARQHGLLISAFHGLPFQQYFAVKALPNPAVLNFLHQLGSGFDCASLHEIALTKAFRPRRIVFNSNNTSSEQFAAAAGAGAAITVDDIALIDRIPASVCDIGLRVTFADGFAGSIVGGQRSKFGMTPDQARQACRRLFANGIDEVGLHCMQVANLTDHTEKTKEAQKLISFAKEVESANGRRVSALNFGGGLGLPYRPEDTPFDVQNYGAAIRSELIRSFKRAPKVMAECGRFVTGPAGYLVAQVRGVYEKPHRVIGLDVSTATVPRITIYEDAYHHISFPDAEGRPEVPTDVTGAMCESRDKFCESRLLPTVCEGDICVVHDVGAHAIAMSNTYNGMLRPAEFLLRGEEVTQISRTETYADVTSRFINEKIGVIDVQSQFA